MFNAPWQMISIGRPVAAPLLHQCTSGCDGLGQTCHCHPQNWTLPHGGGGGRQARALDLPPPLEIAREVPAIGAEDPGKKSCLPWEGVKFFHPMCLYSKYLEFHGEFNHGGKS